MMNTPMGIAAKNLTASDDVPLMPNPVNARTRPNEDVRLARNRPLNSKEADIRRGRLPR
jgi:hypothetical protein